MKNAPALKNAPAHSLEAPIVLRNPHLTKTAFLFDRSSGLLAREAPKDHTIPPFGPMIFRSFSENSSHRARVFSWEHPIPTANTDGLGRFGNTKGVSIRALPMPALDPSWHSVCAVQTPQKKRRLYARAAGT